jgi:hypothetical protein
MPGADDCHLGLTSRTWAGSRAPEIAGSFLYRLPTQPLHRDNEFFDAGMV